MNTVIQNLFAIQKLERKPFIADKHEERRSVMRATRYIAVLLLIMPILFGVQPHQIMAQDKLVRAAVVTDWKGKASVTKTGSKKAIQVFKKMSINEGDRIVTGAESKVVLQLVGGDKEDTVTIGEDSDVTFTSLKSEKGIKTKISVWSGSAWLKVKSAAGADARFELETPTTVMAVRGTQFGVHVSPADGRSRLQVAAGVVEVRYPVQELNHHTKSSYGDQSMLMLDQLKVYPAQSALFIPRQADNGHVRAFISYIDPALLANEKDAAMIEAMAAGYQDAVEENNQLWEKWTKAFAESSDFSSPSLQSYAELGKDGSATSITEELLERAKHNIDYMIGAVMLKAEANGVVSKPALTSWLKEAGLNANHITLKLTDDERSMQQSIQLIEQESVKVDMSDRLGQLTKELEAAWQQRLQNQKELDQKAQAELEEKYKDRLSAQEKLQYEKDRLTANEELCTHASAYYACSDSGGVTGETSTGGGDGNGGKPENPDPEPEPEPEPEPKPANVIELGTNSKGATAGSRVMVNVLLARFDAPPQVSAVELTFEVAGGDWDMIELTGPDKKKYRHGANGKLGIAFTAAEHASSSAVDQMRPDGKQLVYRVLKTSAGAVSLENGDVLLSLPVTALQEAKLVISIKDVKMYDAAGKLIEAHASKDQLAIPIQQP